MAVPEQTPYKEYTANGITTVFPLDFDVLEQDHLIVIIDDLEPAVGSWHLDAAKDAVVFNSAPVSGAIVKIRRDAPFSRTTNYQLYDRSFLPDPVNKDFDAIWRKLQEVGVSGWLISQEILKQGVSLQQLEDLSLIHI
ncbi:phage tail fiber protein [Acinetobacter baumannii]